MGLDMSALTSKPSKVKLKICIVGEKAVGKTSLLNRYVFNSFNESAQTTHGAKMSLVSCKQIRAGGLTVDVEIALFDMMGEKAERDAFKDVLFWGAHGFLAVGDATRSETIRALPSWVKVVRQIAGEIPFQVLINKVDLAPQGTADPDDSGWLLSRFPTAQHHPTSAKSGAGVTKAVDSLVKALVESNLTKSAVAQEMDSIGDFGNKILSFAKRRSPLGVAKKDLLLVFKSLDHDSLMEEVESLQKAGLIQVELTGPGSFVVKLTEKGAKQLERTVKQEPAISKMA